MHLNQLQHLLEELNAVRAPLRVTEVLLPPAQARALRGTAVRSAGEQVFALQDDAAEALHLGVYIDPRWQCQLAFSDPRRALTDDNLPALHGAVEGISHFVALSHAAGIDRQVSALELELQAEIDKFVLSARLADAAAPHSLDPAALFERQFARARFASDLGAEEAQRYRLAHRGAARLLQHWLRRYDGRCAHPAMVAELRRFFRLSRADKLRLADATG
jgi:hypothetical protein